MPVPFIRCRNKVTGAEADIPETALPGVTDWVPVEDVPTKAPWSAPAEAKDPDEKTAKTATASTTKSKAADTAANEKE